jgi:FkbM family methyltransferase
MATPSLIEAPWGTFAPRGWRRTWLRLLHSLPTGKAWRRLALWLRKPLKNTLGQIVDLEVWGLKLRLRSKGNLSEQRLILMPQFLDTAEREALADFLRDGGVFFDIGANAGMYSLWIASLRNPAIRGEAFEPDPELCSLLKANLATNDIGHIHLNNCALGRTEGTVTLVAGAGNKGENRVESAGASASQGLAVAMTTLPAFLAAKNIARIDALKIDVEGHEVDVLEPLFKEVPSSAWPRLLICEVTHDGGRSLANLLSAHGYQLANSGRLNGIYRLA